MKIIDLSNIRPEPLQGHTSKGDQPKWQANGKWYKTDHMGYEALAEVLVSRLLAKSSVSQFVIYEPIKLLHEGKAKNACVSNSFRNENEILVPFERLHRAFYGQGLARALAHMETVEKIHYTVDFVEKVTGLKQVGEYLTMLMEIDSFFLNEDRHTNNLAVIRNEDTKEYRLCPVFDNGLSLLSDLNDYPLKDELFGCIAKVKAKPFDTDFDEQTSAAEQLYGLQLRFSFSPGDFADIFDELEEYYPKEILDRVERVLREQMRKYGIYFKR